MLPQWQSQSTSMTVITKHNNDHKFPNYNIQLARTKENTQKAFKLKNSKWARSK
jgi:hypothetical protein